MMPYGISWKEQQATTLKITVMATKINKNKHVWEGWTVGDFIEELKPQVAMIMDGQSWREPFKSKQELADWCKNNQPYYKKRIPDVNNHFARMYNLK
jgi:hypothetical protein